MIAYRAMELAKECHATQKRKYTGNPYSDHLAEVAAITASAPSLQGMHILETAIAVAWLHDSLEDTDLQPSVIHRECAAVVLRGVQLLTDNEEGNRAHRKELSRQRLHKAPSWVQTIKCADLISNTQSIVQYDPRFAATYLREKIDLLEVLRDADRYLRNKAYIIATEGIKYIEGHYGHLFAIEGGDVK
jgi:(p)ppGpp synthase/HD superfamily hydrolase